MSSPSPFPPAASLNWSTFMSSSSLLIGGGGDGVALRAGNVGDAKLMGVVLVVGILDRGSIGCIGMRPREAAACIRLSSCRFGIVGGEFGAILSVRPPRISEQPPIEGADSLVPVKSTC